MLTWIIKRESRGTEVLGVVPKGRPLPPSLADRVRRLQAQGHAVDFIHRPIDRAWDGQPLGARERRLVRRAQRHAAEEAGE